MRQDLALNMGAFGLEAFSVNARRQNLNADAFVHQAILYYLSQRGIDRMATRVPAFARNEPEPNGGGQLHVSVELEEDDWATLTKDAEEQDVSLERLVKHAVLLVLADLDQGRITSRILED